MKERANKRSLIAGVTVFSILAFGGIVLTAYGIRIHLDSLGD